MTQRTPLRKNDIVDVIFEDMTHDGQGVAKVDGYPIFVSNGITGEEAQIKITKVNKNYGFGQILKLKRKSANRIEIPANEKHKYGGCQIHHINYEGQLQFKQNLVEQVLSRIGKLEDITIHPIIGMKDPWNYRNKAQVPVGEKNGKLISGFYKPRSHEIINTDESVIHMNEIDEAVNVVKEICEQLKISAYNEETHKGVLRHIMARFGKQTEELMIVLITSTKDIPHKDKLVNEIITRLPKVKSIAHNINQERTNVILGKETTILWGNECIYDYIGDVQFAISPLSFYQVNPVQTKILYEKTLQYAKLTGEETVIDAYCGIGTISLFLAKRAKKVYGVEVIPEAIEDAKRNAELNGISNVEFVAGEAEAVMPKWAEEGIRPDVIVVDPPRKGCDESLLQTIVQMRPKRIVYVSCNPATLARDLRILEDSNYKTIEVQPVDMFPMTVHVECCVSLEKK